MTKRIVYSFLLMLLFPILTLILGLKERSYAFKKFILILFITFFGSTIIYEKGHDAFVHRQNVIDHYQELEFSEFLYELKQILLFAPTPDTNDDVYIHILSYFVGSVLGMPQFFFVFVAFIYAYFFAGSILKVLQITPKTKLSFLFYAFAVVFLVHKNMEGINTVRTWTGFWVLFYGAFSYFETKNKKYLFLLLLPPLIHVAYFVMAIPTYVVILFGNRFKWLYVGIFVLSFFYGVNQSIVMSQLAQTDLGESKSRGYYVDDEGESELMKYENATWYRQLQKSGIQKYALYVVTFTLLIGGIYFKGMTNLESNLFSIGILTKSLSNFSIFLSALAARSSLIGAVFILAALILIIKRGYFSGKNTGLNVSYHFFFFISFLMFTPFIIYKIADIIYFVSVYMLALPFIPWIFSDANLSIRELLQWFL